MAVKWLAGCGLAMVVAVGVGVVLVEAQTAGPREIKVKLVGSHGQAAGTVTFKQVKKGVKMTIKLENLPFGEHAVHIHEYPVCDAPDFHGAGGHFNPAGKQHGYENPMGHHNGDLPGNVMVDEDHMGEASFVLHDISLDPGAPDSLFLKGGTSVVVHQHADDEKTDPSGDAGNRIACGVIRRQTAEGRQ
ncbi:MAG TPA: superoxide dismutase family protein [Acidobacteriaceae bacterium]|jgi:Cu-Zn family superoxide dismutase|nr:superoxide dismutase family protein [Acidobacteriaceae bacterium]